MERRDRDPEELLDQRIDAGETAIDTAAHPELAREERQLRKLHQMLVAGRVQARPGFRDAVMASLPAEPAWATRGAAAWRTALVALAALFTLTVALLLLGGAHVGDASPALAALRA